MSINTTDGFLLEKPHDACEIGNCMKPHSFNTTITVCENDITTSTTTTVSRHCNFKVFDVHGCGKKHCEDHAGKENHIAKKNCCKECWDNKSAEIC